MVDPGATYGLLSTHLVIEFSLRISPELQHDFCAVWNEVVREAQNHGTYSGFVYILREIRHHYISLHQGTDAVPTAFSGDINRFDPIFYEPSSYPLCNLLLGIWAHHCVECSNGDVPDNSYSLNNS